MKGRANDFLKVTVAAALTIGAIFLNARAILGVSPARGVVVDNAPISSGATEKVHKKLAGTLPIDPSLNYSRLAISEGVVYEGTGRDIFSGTASSPVRADRPLPKPPDPGPAVRSSEPKCSLRFFGFGSMSNSPKKVFLSEGDAIFVAVEGQIVNRRYRIGKIGSSSVEVEDLIEHSLHTLSLPDSAAAS